MKKYFAVAIAVTLVINALNAQSLYFPPLIGNAWDTLSPASLGWCVNYLDTLDDLLLRKNTKAVIILKDGKIAHEKYFGTFTVDSLWYWASAGKTLTAFNIGQAQEQNFLSINDSSSRYLGSGWTSCSATQEGAITIRNQLTMTTGLDDGVANDYCTLPSCLQYLADAGTRWAYHNAPYTLLQNVLDSATGNFTSFFNTQLRNRIGLDGFWFVTNVYNHIYYSKPRSMARFGLLMLNNGIWNTDTLMHDVNYFHDMTNTSQNLNLSYGYLWWLNGKNSFMLPGSQFVFNGSIIPNAPADMFCALGKNDQKIHVVPSQHLVIVRMGNSADSTSLVPIALDYEMWDVLNKVFCNQSGLQDNSVDETIKIYPNPATEELNIDTSDQWNKKDQEIKVFNVFGREIYSEFISSGIVSIKTRNGLNGVYLIKTNLWSKKIVKE